MLYEQTDEDHYLTIAQIMEQLEKEYGISTSRGTVGDDIKALQELGIEIEVVPSTQKRFSLICRKFDLPELKTLIDAVESARFIPKKKSAALVEKLGSLTSQHNTEKLVRNVDVENRLKADNEKIYYIMETLNDAINARKKVSFQYFTYNVRKEQKLKYDGYTYVFSPYKLIWNGDYYDALRDANISVEAFEQRISSERVYQHCGITRTANPRGRPPKEKAGEQA